MTFKMSAKVRRLIVVCSLCWLIGVDGVPGAEPTTAFDPQLQIQQDGVELTLVVEHPQVVTPTGIDIDGTGQLWAVSSHTHFRPDDYPGPKHDEVLVLNVQGQKEPQRTVFYNQTDATMDLELEPDFEPGGWVYLAERDRILRVRDTNGDGAGDQEENIAVLTTEADYPHNGMSGLAWHPSGDLVFALGENFWKPWRLTDRDGKVIEGTGEGGIFRCQPDGSSLRRIAKGFWNPFGVCVRADGSMFAAENDPGARPPCRLLHLVEGGDYGYQRRYGNSPFHPFVAWNGELQGTLPMMHSLGEAPCGIASLGNGLIVPSWTDHRIDFYPLQSAGATFQTKRISLVSGGLNFRPTCITQATPNTFYLTDWVYGSYELHQRGRIWKLEISPKNSWLGDPQIPPPNEEATLAARLRSGKSHRDPKQLFLHAQSPDPFIRRAAIDAIALQGSFDVTSADKLGDQDLRTLLLAIRKALPKDTEWVKYFLAKPNPEIRFEALRWIADEELKEFQAEVEAILAEPQLAYPIFESSLAATNALNGKAELGVVDRATLMKHVKNSSAPSRTRAFALRLLDPRLKQLNEKLWQELLETGDPLLISELTRSLCLSEKSNAIPLLQQIASDENIDLNTRADAVTALRGDALIPFVSAAEQTLREEAIRSLRFGNTSANTQALLQQVAKDYPGSSDLVAAALQPKSVKQGRPEVSDLKAWQNRLSAIKQPIDLEAGRRVFHHSSVGTCVKCHRHQGRGSAVGPDLSAASNQGDPHRLLRALLQPSRDVDPQYFPRMLITEDGQVFTGIMLRDGGGGNEFYRDNAGRERKFATKDIVERKELRTSMMPDGLIDLMTDREIRDLLAFLDQRRSD